MPITLSGDLLHIKNGNTYTSANTMINGSISEVNAARDNGVAAVNSTASAKTAEINARVNELTSAASTNKEVTDMFAEAFSASKSYTAGEYVIYTTNGVNKLYQFTVNHAAGAWKGSADTKEVTVAGSVSDFATNLVKGQNTEPTDPDTRIWIDTDSTKSVVVPQIDDDNVSTTDTWSSSKIKSEDDGIREEVGELKSAITKQSNKNLLNGYAPLSFASPTVYEFADNIMTIGTNTSGDSVITYAIFDLGLLADTYADTGVRLTISGVVAEKMGTNVTIHSGVISSSGSFTRIANWVNSDITGEFSRTTTISADTLQTHTGKHIGVRIYGGYQVAVTLNSKTVFENLQIEIGSAATDYEPYLTAVDYTARKNISNEVTRIDSLIDTEISNVEGQIDTAVAGIESELSAYIGRSLVNYGNIVTTGLDLNGGDFVHPGTWTVNDVQYMPANSPTDKKCRIVSFASQTNNSIYTLQLVADIAGNIYTRFSPNTTVWESEWYDWKSKIAEISEKADEYPFNVQAFKPMWVNSELFVNNYTITHHGASEENKVSKMYALYDGMDSAASAAGITITKDNLGKDASNTFNIYNYKVSLNSGEKPVVLLIVGEHGDELNSAMLGYYAYREIIDGVLTKYLKYVDFWVVPLMNPWGYEHNTRNNSNDVNLNRDFPCEWQYSTSGHNKTGNTALSQPETNIIYNLIVNNQSKILFMCNKHDTGPIAGKIGTNQEDIVGYMSSYLDNDIIVNNGMAQIQNALVRQTDAWIIDNCSIDISNRQLIASRKVKTSGSMDLFVNSIGVHGSLVEICNSAVSADYPYYPSGAGHHADLARLGLNLFVNYLMTTIENNMDILHDNRLYGSLKYYSRKLVDGNYVDIELEWTGTELVEKT